jgi:ATP-dependent helicase/nuclease subunit A
MPSDTVPIVLPGGEDDGSDRLQAVTQVERNVFVIAGAGTGKTSLLTARLCYFLVWRAFHHARSHGRPQAAVREVVAMTFTEKAAAEMRDRARTYLQAWLDPGQPVEPADARFVAAVRRDLYERLGSTESEWRRVLRTVLAYLNEVRISTIHSFCAGLLRAYAFEASIPPQFEIIGDDLWDQIFHEEWLFYLLDLLGHDPRPEPPYRRARAAIRWFSRRYHLDLETLSSMARSAAISSITRGHSLDQQTAWEARAWEAYHRRLRDRGFLSAALEAVRAYRPRSPKSQAFQAFLIDHLTSLIQGSRGRRYPPPDLNDRWRDIRSRLERAAEACASQLPEVRVPRFLHLFRAFLFSVDPVLTRRMGEAFAPFLDRLRRRLRQEGYLTYDDLLWETYRLLTQSPTVRQSLQAQVRHILVDEFQDTNPVQMDILRLLGQDVTTHRWRPGCLFIVGDPKQSIYAFRDADLAAFQRFYEDLQQSPDFLSCVLRQNFRSGPALLDFVNAVCGPLFEEDRRRYPLAEGEDLTDRYGLLPAADPSDPAAESITDFLKRTVVHPDRYVQPPYIPVYPASPRPSDSGRPVLYCLEDASDDRDDLWAQTIATAVVRWAARQGGSSGEPPWERIAVLFRSMTHTDRLARLARTFHELGIPFVVEGDRQFFQKTEVLDVLNMLRVWVNPYDRPALIGWLRSPIVGVSDDFLFHLAGWECREWVGTPDAGVLWPPVSPNTTGPGAPAVLQAADPSVWTQARAAFLRQFPRLADEWDRAETAIRRLQDHRCRHRDDPPARVLTTLFQEFRIPAVYAPYPTGPQRVMNLWKLVELAYRWSDQGDTTVDRWVQRLQTSARVGVEESESLLADPELNACRWMTIHKAKGLEFDLVVVADAHFLGQPAETGRDAAGPCQVELTPDGRLGIAVQRGPAGHPLYNVTFLLHHLRRNQLEEAEKKRLFYVACTRARDHLVLVCLTPRPGRRDRTACRLAQCLQAGALLDVRPIRSRADLGALERPESARPASPLGPDREAYVRVWTDFRQRWERFCQAEPVGRRPSDHDRVPDVASVPVEDDGLGPPLLGTPAVYGPEAGSPHGRWVGTLVHEALARIPLDPTGDDLRWVEAFLTYEAPLLLQRALVEGDIRETDVPDVLEESFQLLRLFLGSPLWHYMKPRIRAREIPFLGPADARGRRFWEGRIDVILEDASPQGTTLWVCDYKTDAESRPSVLIRQYRSQIQVYRAYIQKVFPHPNVQAALIGVRQARWIPVPTGRTASRPPAPLPIPP